MSHSSSPLTPAAIAGCNSAPLPIIGGEFAVANVKWRVTVNIGFHRRLSVLGVEVVHLVVPDHSAKVWLIVQSICTDMEHAKQWLSRHQAELTVRLASVI